MRLLLCPFLLLLAICRREMRNVTDFSVLSASPPHPALALQAYRNAMREIVEHDSGLRGRVMSTMRKANLSVDPAIVQVRQAPASARPEPRSKRSSVRV